MSMIGHYASYPLNTENGLVYCTCHGESGDIGLFERHNCKPKGVIHVGAWDCAEMGCYKHLFGENVIWVEANTHTYENITLPALRGKNNADGLDNPNWKVYNNVIFNEDGLEVDMINEGGESYVHLNPFNSTSMFTKRLDTLILEEKINMDNYDFINIDTEGSELKVLQSIEKNLNKINYVFVEVSLSKRQEYGCTFDEMINYLNSKGFDLVETSDSINTLSWGDAFFVRRSQ